MRNLISRHPVVSIFSVLFLSIAVYIFMSLLAYAIGTAWASLLMDIVLGAGSFLIVRYGCGSPEYKAHVTFYQVFVGIVVVIALYISLALAANLVYTSFGDAFYDIYTESREESSLAGQALILFTTVVTASVSEELLFRGAVYGIMRRTRMPLVVSAIVSSLLFAVAHATFVHLIPATIMGALCCSVYEYTGRLRWSILVHSVYNTMSYLAAGILVPDWLGSAPMVVLQCAFWIAVMILIMEMCRRRQQTKQEG